MNMAYTRSSPSYSSAARTPARGGASAAAGTVEAVSFAAGQRFSPNTPQPPSVMRDVMDIAGGVTLLFGLVVGMICLGFFTRDSMAVGKALSEQSTGQSSMVCKDGRMAHGDGSIPDFVFEDGVFICTDWRTQQALELEAAQKYTKRY
ncbi:hypothetical protein SAMN05216359_11541 [Roseateles sp. YR242]|uniref:hypothetical protein n=1 Tax=Roseateles sp. YR242 TaxID=1855305 RepID=UPI0008BC4CDC|nr:hypothetical protein [Roseateles sp. YR242]SEL73469.1 hypothetical protein SAMN05216359_11541 [Roseateles sp. YR242]